MSTIDAAIIKALVEHIGGDSSGIPDGTIGGGGGSGVDVSTLSESLLPAHLTWIDGATLDKLPTLELRDFKDEFNLKIGDVLIVKHKNTNEPVKFICSGVELSFVDCEEILYTFTNKEEKIEVIHDLSTSTLSANCAKEGYLTFDNVTTGLFRPANIEKSELGAYLSEIFNGLTKSLSYRAVDSKLI